jgi:protein-disulfide isomerase
MDTNVKLILAVGAGALLGAGAMTQSNVFGGGVNEAKVKEIVREVIKSEPKLIIESVQNMQNADMQEKTAKASEALKDKALRLAIYDNANSPFIGPADSDKVVVEFFDYNCPACKMQFKELAKLAKQDPDIKVIFKEYPIFGPQSDTNSKIALAVFKLDPEKYFPFHEKMMSHEGRADEAAALGFAKSLGLDVAKIKAEIAKPEYAEMLQTNRGIGDKLHVQGTPTLIVGDELIPHAVNVTEIEQKLGKK